MDTFTVHAEFRDMLSVIPCDMLRAEIDRRAEDESRRVRTTTKTGATIEGQAAVDNILSDVSDLDIKHETKNRNLFPESRDEPLRPDEAKDIAAAVRDGDMMYFKILLNRFSPNAGII